MEDFVSAFFSGDYMPHGHCYLWQPGILWVNVISDALIAISYFSIPFALLLIVKKRQDFSFRSAFLLFAMFILCCGITHLFSIYTIWHGSYGLHGISKALTAIVSMVTAVALFRWLPLILSVPSESKLKKAVDDAAEEKLKRIKLETERRSEAIFQFTTELIPTGLLVIDANLNVRLANNALEEMFGYEPKSLIGESLQQLLVSEVATHHDALVKQYMDNPSQRYAMAAGRVVRGKRKDGKEISVEISLSVHDFAGEKHAFASVVDVSKITTEKSFLVESTNRIKRAIDASNNGIWEWNVQTDEVWYSPRLMTMIGKDAVNDVPNLEYWKQHIHPEDMANINRSLDGHFSGQNKFDVVYRGMSESGNYEWMHARGEVLFDPHGRPLLMSGTLTNINDIKMLEQKLHEKTKFLDAVLEKSLCGVYIFDLNSQSNIYINSQYTEITGYTMDELGKFQADQNLLPLFHPDDADAVQQHFIEVTENDKRQGASIKYRFRHKKGHWIWCYSRDSVYSYDEQNRPQHILGTFFDITDLVEGEKQLRSLALDFQTTFEQAAVGIAHVDLKGCFLKANRKLCETLGYSRDQLLKMRFSEITYDEDRPESEELLRKILGGEINQFSKEKRYVCANGSILWANLTVSLACDDAGNHSHFISVIEDVTQRKRVEAALEESNASLERFAYSASHDLQEPLRKICAFSERLHERLKGKLVDPEARFELERMADAARRMREMINHLLELSRYTRARIHKVKTLFSSMYESVQDDLSTLIEENEAVIHIEQDFEVWADPFSFELVIRNLITNSIRYAQTGVKPQVNISSLVQQNKRIIKISDNGVGFDPKHSEHIFEPFRRLVGREYAGSGMGLAICRQIIKAHNGRIYAVSQQGKGAIFYVEIPAGMAQS